MGWLDGLLSRALLLVAGLTLWRFAMLWWAGIELSTDEAQYWRWSTHFSVGEFSKPPLIGWIIAASTAVFGESAAGVRAAAPLFHGATALVITQLGREAFGPRTGQIAALIYILMPAASLGAILMTTDTPMLFFLALALWAQWRLARGAGTGWAIGLGIAVGLGMLAKHAMLFGVAGMSVAALVAPGWRFPLRHLALAAGLAMAVFTPNLWWIVRNEFVTVHHLAQSGAGEGVRLSLSNLARFLLEQFAVFGPIAFLAFWASFKRWSNPTARGFLASAATILAIVSLQALTSHALANWAVGFTVAASVTSALWLAPRARLLALSLTLGAGIALALPLISVFGTGLHLPGQRLALARYLGHDALSAPILRYAAQTRAGAIIADDRDTLAALEWARRGGGPEIFAAPYHGAPRHHWDLKQPLPEDYGGKIVRVLRDDTPAAPCAEPGPQWQAGPGFQQGHRFTLALMDESCARRRD